MQNVDHSRSSLMMDRNSLVITLEDGTFFLPLIVLITLRQPLIFLTALDSSCYINHGGYRMRWQPKPEVLTLDNLTPEDHKLFRFILTRNGHNVALYGGRDKAEADLKDRTLRFPADDWSIIDRDDLNYIGGTNEN